MTVSAGRADASAPALAADGAPPDNAEQRGRLAIADRVVERVCGYAVTLVPDAVAAPRRVLGVNVGASRPDAPAHVDAVVHGGVATVSATIAVRYPRPVREVADQLRRVLREQVARTTGVEVRSIDLDVVSLSVATMQRRVQ